MTYRLAVLGGIALALAQLPMTTPAGAECGPRPVPCATESGDPVPARSGQAPFDGTSTR
ncbi:hypothetical protein ACFXK0_14760 [Nocardia sp. NPDC059177]|uniref:hypothetical protein n=1 Tax=Nocardia sp. NPDC059177 TaxID=3346759 RepID=UPI003692C0E1